MTTRLGPSPRRRGSDLLLAQTGCVGVLAAGTGGPAVRAPASEHLRTELGGQLAERLVGSLVRRQRDERRRGSSTP
jgi:hypothetical protein